MPTPSIASTNRAACLLVSLAIAGCALPARASDPSVALPPGNRPAPAIDASAPAMPAPAVAAPALGVPGASIPATAIDARVPIAIPPSASDSPSPAALPPAGTAGTAPAAPELPQGLGIGTPTGGAPFAAGGRLSLETGLYNCELNRRVIVRRIADDGQSLVLNWLGKDHAFAAVQARTGALRFENAGEGLVWLVIIGKSMLLDTRKGQQLANECRL